MRLPYNYLFRIMIAHLNINYLYRFCKNFLLLQISFYKVFSFHFSFFVKIIHCIFMQDSNTAHADIWLFRQ
jgi:hypothetical protein